MLSLFLVSWCNIAITQVTLLEPRLEHPPRSIREVDRYSLITMIHRRIRHSDINTTSR